MAKCLVTGASSGLGKYLREAFNAEGFDRSVGRVQEPRYDYIIHCGWDLKKNIPAGEGSDYLDQSQELTKKLLSIPHKKFIFMSTIDVYPKDSKEHTEDEDINLHDVQGIYGLSKLLSEHIVKGSKEHLSLRLSSLLGKYTRYNTATKIATGKDIGISRKSSFNFVTYEQVRDFIWMAIEKRLRGTYNLVADTNVVVQDILDAKNIESKDGRYVYQTGLISPKKLCSKAGDLTKNSLVNYETWSSKL